MSWNSLGVNSGARIVPPNFGRRSPREIALFALRAIFVAATVALFFAWLTSAGTGGRANGDFADADCVGFGRGGLRCGGPTGDGGANQAADSRKDCMSVGRGGLICGRPTK